MSASWGGKLEQRLSALGESASKESIQALAKWIGFNRKYSSVITSVLFTALQNKSNSTARQWLYWQVVHEVLVLDIGTGSKWERLLDLRSILGETGVIPAIEALRSNDQLVKPEKLEGLVKQWDDHNVFGGPTLVSQIRRLVTSETIRATKTQSTATLTATTEQTKASSPQRSDRSATTTAGTAMQSPVEAPVTDGSLHQDDAVKPADGGAIKPKNELSHGEKMKTDERKPVAKRSSFSHVEKDVSYNFEDKGIPYAKVESRDFLTPCKAIATLQIARDLRNDAAVQLSSLISSIPEDVKKACREAKEKKDSGGDDTALEFPPALARDFSMRVNESLLDMDLEEQWQNVRTFEDIVERQREARKKLIFLLIQSRCQFGSKEAAEKFYILEETTKMLKRRKDLLSDAMALEGLDFDSSEAVGDGKELDDLDPLTWCKPDDVENGSNKRLKTDDV